MQRSVSSSEFSEYAKSFELAPRWQPILIRLIAQLTAITINVNRKKGTKSFTWEDLVPELFPDRGTIIDEGKDEEPEFFDPLDSQEPKRSDPWKVWKTLKTGFGLLAGKK